MGLGWSYVVQAIGGRPRWQSIVALTALAIATLGALTNLVTARANTYGNTDQFEQSNRIASPWWGGVSRGRSERHSIVPSVGRLHRVGDGEQVITQIDEPTV